MPSPNFVLLTARAMPLDLNAVSPVENGLAQLFEWSVINDRLRVHLVEDEQPVTL